MNNDEHKNCPYCDEEIKAIAVKCRYCKSMLVDEKKQDLKEEAVVGRQTNKIKDINVSDYQHPSRRNKNFGLIAVLFIAILLVIFVSMFIAGLLDVNDMYALLGSEKSVENSEAVIEEESKEDSETIIHKQPEDSSKTTIQDEAIDNFVIVDVPSTTFLHLRSGSGSSYSSLDQLDSGTKLEIINEARCSDGDLWLQVITPDGKEGFVHSDYVVYQNYYTSYMEHTLPTDIEERIHNCKIMKVFHMSFEEVLNILGEPDETIWLAGDVYIWNDASELIGNNEDGLSEQKELLIGGESIKAIDFKEFGDIKIGMSFHDAKEILGDGLKITDTEGSEWFQYAKVYEYEEYRIIFESMDLTSPIRMIMVWRH